MEPVVILTYPACGLKQIHDKHVVRHGFLHLRRTKCAGFSPEDYELYNNEMIKRIQYLNFHKPHKHSFKFVGAEEGNLVFVCKDPKCSTYCSWSRWVFDFRTLNTPEDFGLYKGRGWCGRRDMHFAHQYHVVKEGEQITYSHCHGLTERVAKYFSGSMV